MQGALQQPCWSKPHTLDDQLNKLLAEASQLIMLSSNNTLKQSMSMFDMSHGFIGLAWG